MARSLSLPAVVLANARMVSKSADLSKRAMSEDVRGVMLILTDPCSQAVPTRPLRAGQGAGFRTGDVWGAGGNSRAYRLAERKRVRKASSATQPLHVPAAQQLNPRGFKDPQLP
jgi:hypothetical protein